MRKSYNISSYHLPRLTAVPAPIKEDARTCTVVEIISKPPTPATPEPLTDPAFAAVVYKAHAIAEMFNALDPASNRTDRATFNLISQCIDRAIHTGGQLKDNWDTPLDVLSGIEERLCIAL